jgi:hypothetical protein
MDAKTERLDRLIQLLGIEAGATDEQVEAKLVEIADHYDTASDQIRKLRAENERLRAEKQVLQYEADNAKATARRLTVQFSQMDSSR